MKAQFATLEVLLSLAIVISAASATSYIISRSGYAFNAEHEAISRSAAAYDFIMQLTQNLTSEECLAITESNGSSCMDNYTQYYRYVYGIKRIGVIGKNASGYNYSDIYCSMGQEGQFCVGVS
ncbi:MAG: hypothetical protein ACYCO0_03125 [Candidatus Micrarchaeaceae archaeon]